MGFIDVIKSDNDWRNSLTKENQVFYRTTIYNTKKGKEPRVVIRIGENIVRELGWKVGENFSLMQDEDNPLSLRLKPNPRNGYVLKPAVIPQDEKHSDQIGKVLRATWEAPILKERPIPNTEKTTIKIIEFEVVKDMLDIEVPRDFQ